MSAARGWRIAGLLACVAACAWATSRAAAAGASLTTALGLIGGLSWAQVAGLALLWVLGLYAHAVVLAASLPGLTRRRALALNLAGSAVSGVLPLGGLAGAALNLTMIRSWGHSALDFARFLTVAKACDVVAKLLMPAAALTVLLGCGVLTPAAAGPWIVAAGVAFAVGSLLLRALCGRATALLRAVRAAARASSWVTRRRDHPVGASWPAAVAELLTGTDLLVRRRRVALTLGTAGYLIAQGALLWCCLRAVGVQAMPAVVFGGLVAERLTTLAVVTPGGTGPAEAATVTTLIALGTDATGALAGVLLFRAFVSVAAILVGAAVALGWWAPRTTRARRDRARQDQAHKDQAHQDQAHQDEARC